MWCPTLLPLGSSWPFYPTEWANLPAETLNLEAWEEGEGVAEGGWNSREKNRSSMGHAWRGAAPCICTQHRSWQMFFIELYHCSSLCSLEFINFLYIIYLSAHCWTTTTISCSVSHCLHSLRLLPPLLWPSTLASLLSPTAPVNQPKVPRQGQWFFNFLWMPWESVSTATSHGAPILSSFSFFIPNSSDSVFNRNSSTIVFFN